MGIKNQMVQFRSASLESEICLTKAAAQIMSNTKSESQDHFVGSDQRDMARTPGRDRLNQKNKVRIGVAIALAIE